MNESEAIALLTDLRETERTRMLLAEQRGMISHKKHKLNIDALTYVLEELKGEDK